ncbi:hypothetical protein NDI45_12785 [Leptolyngbya sp. GB1-A1]|uniref:hypothetical protein n=1 Tax=Leptolyngbya sp. GB1-A1 TaxID=2933908 RepID=UPI0032976BAD
MVKKKGDKGGNPAPVQTPEFRSKQFPPAVDLPAGVELAKKPFCVKLPVEIDAAIREHPQSAAWVRQVLIAAVEKDLIQQ